MLLDTPFLVLVMRTRNLGRRQGDSKDGYDCDHGQAKGKGYAQGYRIWSGLHERSLGPPKPSIAAPAGNAGSHILLVGCAMGIPG